jgi:O-acetylserine/cysteine efflux transporter
MSAVTTPAARMSGSDAGRALLVVIIWGLNFVVIDRGLKTLPPLLFVTLRYAFTVFPAIFFVARPGVRWYWIVGIGLSMNAGQFGLLFVGIHRGVPAGLASLVIQCQALFTVIFAAAVLRETPRATQLVGTLLASIGILVIALGHGASTPIAPLLLVVGAGACWGVGNIFTRYAKARSAFGLIVWAGLVAPLPLMALSLWLEGPRADLTAIQHLFPAGALAVAYSVVAATMFGFGTWTSLLKKYPAPVVAPFSLLVPVFGILSAWIVLGETPSWGELGGGVVVMLGLALVTGVANSAWQRAGRLARGRLAA